MFSTLSKREIIILSTFHLSSANALNLVQSKILLFGKVLIPLPNNKILDHSKLKAFADDKINVTAKQKFVLGRVENIVGEGKNAGYQHFSPFPTMISKGFYFKVVKCLDCVVKSSNTGLCGKEFKHRIVW